MIKLNMHVSGKGPNLVLIHGWAMSPLVWQEWLLDLAKSYRVICVELPGHGDSDYRERWQMNELLEAMAEQLPDSCSVLGWSLGGMVALAYAGAYPQRVNKLLMLASSPKFVQSDDWQCATTNSAFDAFSLGIKDKPAMTIKRFIKLQTQGVEQSKEMNAFLRGLVKTNVDDSHEGLVSGLDILRTNDLRGVLKSLTCRILMVLGKKDQLVPVEAGQRSMSLNPNIDLCVINNASHVPFLSHPLQVSQAIDRFMRAGEGLL